MESFSNRKVVLVLLALAILCLSLPNASFVQAEEAKQIRIGVVSGLTGPLADVSVTVKNSAILAWKQLDPSGRVKFIFEDDGFSPKNTVAAVNKLVDQDKVDGLIVFGSGPSLAVADIAENHKLPMIAIAMTDKVAIGKHYVYRFYMTSQTQNDAVTKEVLRRNYKRIVVVASLHEAMVTLSDAFLGKAQNITIAKEQILPSDNDLRTIALKVRGNTPDAVYLLALSPQAGLFAKQLRGIGYKGDLFSSVTIYVKTQLAVAEGALNGAWFVAFKDRGADAFYKDYKKEFNEDPACEGPVGYDAASMFIEASRVGINEYFKVGREFQGILGPLKIDANHDIDIPAVIKVIKRSGGADTAVELSHS